MLLWFVRAFGYFGVQFNIEELGKAIVLNFTLMGIAEIFGSLASIHIKREYNRKMSMQWCLIISGLAIFAARYTNFQSLIALGSSA